MQPLVYIARLYVDRADNVTCCLWAAFGIAVRRLCALFGDVTRYMRAMLDIATLYVDRADNAASSVWAAFGIAAQRLCALFGDVTRRMQAMLDLQRFMYVVLTKQHATY